MDLSAPAILKALQSFRKTKVFDILLLIVLGFVAVGLFEFTSIGGIGVCLAIILPPVSVFVIPYWLGERRMKRFALNAIPVFVIALVVITALQTQAVVTQGPPSLTSGVPSNTAASALPSLTLWNGTVTPYNAPSGNQTYAFHVRLKTAGAVNTSQLRVYLNISEIVGLSETPAAYQLVRDPNPLYANTTNGTWYITWKALNPSVYGFQFFASDYRGNVTYSDPVLAPVIAPWTSYYTVWLISIAQFLIFPVSFYFIILFMYWYTLRTRKMRERMADRVRDEKLDLEKGPRKGGVTGGKKESDVSKEQRSGKTKKAAAFTCTNCGADVTEDDAKCPKCGAVFEE